MRNRNKFNVTYSIVSQESAEQGDFSETGFIIESTDLRDAIKETFKTRTCHVGGIESIERQDYSVSVQNSMEFLTGDYEERTLHIPRNVTPSSRKRILRLVK
jgi:hypothetical protein